MHAGRSRGWVAILCALAMGCGGGRTENQSQQEASTESAAESQNRGEQAQTGSGEPASAADPREGGQRDPPAKTAKAPVKTLLDKRDGYRTWLKEQVDFKAGPAPRPPRDVFRLVKYPSPAGKLSAYVTPSPDDGNKHPAVLWSHGGFGGIGSTYWTKQDPENDQSARAFREAGIVMMCPSWRGENDNPGRFEMFYGEVDDLLAARDYLAALDYVDPDRIYLAGHSTGGTMTLLAAESTDQFRAAFSFGGSPNVGSIVKGGIAFRNYPVPFDYKSPVEVKLRSPLQHVTSIRRPTFYFEGSSSFYIPQAITMEAIAKRNDVPFRAFQVAGGDHFNILAPLTRLIAEKILADTGETCNISFTNEEIQKAFRER